MKDDEKKHGVRRGPVRVMARPTNMELKKVSKAKFLEIRRQENLANKAAEVARQKSLSDQRNVATNTEEESLEDTQPSTNTVVSEVATKTNSAQQEIQKIKKDIKETRANLVKDPKSAKLKKKLSTLEAKLDEAEDALENLEETNNINQ